MKGRLSFGRCIRLGLLSVLVAAAGLSALADVASADKSPSLTFTPPSRDYGTVAQTSSQDFTLTNSGGSTAAKLKITLTGSAAFSVTSDACTGRKLSPHKACVVTVAYAPAAPCASDSATLTVTGKKDKDTPQAQATLTGAGNGLDIQGVIDSEAVDGTSFVITDSADGVSQVSVAVNGQTVFGGVGDPKSLADFNVGDTVDVCAAKQADGSLLAISVFRPKSPAQLVCESVGGTYSGPFGDVLWSCPNGPYSNAAFDALTSQCIADSGGFNWEFATDGTYFTDFTCSLPV
jgi:hypothetical protein